MRDVDIERVRELAGHLQDAVRQLQEIGRVSQDAFLADRRSDLFVVVRDGARPLLDRIPELAREFAGVGIGCEVIVFTESETRAASARGDRFIRTVLEEGCVLAAVRSTAS